jgi:hypothetical protein
MIFGWRESGSAGVSLACLAGKIFRLTRRRDGGAPKVVKDIIPKKK